ncbi:MAG: FtsX-like permease family protein [Lachnospiraceae bacterium]|nr:FtsX-like permease family protein [Ruminococcus sp.]MCM1275827.1 FtsX-like permease family protein [Lachnospiraceae bacterium]
MLKRKLMREFGTNFGQFFSVLILAFLAMALFVTFEGHAMSQNTARDTFHEEVALSDVWVYGEGFSEDDLEAVRALDFVELAQLRMSARGTAPDFDGAQTDIYLMRENVVNMPYLYSGEEFDPADTEGIWLADAFAKRRGVSAGDDFTVEYNGVRFTKKVKGLVESAEYEYRQAENDADMYLENIAVVFMSYDAFPLRDYVRRLIETEKITARKISENTELLKDRLEALGAVGMGVDDITREMLLELVDKIDDEKLAKMFPYTELLVRTEDGGGLSHEREIAEALDGNYAAMVDRSSVAGLARLDSELEQHKSFSYVFVVVFVGIAVLVIAVSMNRMIEKQRTQIGTMNALGMKKSKVLFHYISFSLIVSVIGSALGTVVGTVWLCPIMINMFAEWYIVPGLRSAFHPMYIVMAAVIVLACVLAAYFSCRRLLKVKPAEALRPAPPKQGKRCVFERLPFWKKLSFNAQYNLRDVSRAKLRAFMCVLGTAVGMLMMIYGVGCTELVDQMTELNFTKTTPAGYRITLSSDAPLDEADRLAEELDGELIMMSAVEVAKVPEAVTAEKEKGTVTVLEGKGLYNILGLDNETVRLSAGSVGISRKFSESLGVNVGDKVYWHIYSENDWHEAVVGVVYRSSETQGITYLREDFEETGAEYEPSLLMTDGVSEDVEGLDFVTAVHGKAELEAAFRKAMESVNILIVMMIGFSAVMIIVVLYNSGSLSFGERVKEFATLKVLGLQSARIRGLLGAQNFGLSLVGIILGAPLGTVSLNAMMNSNGENFDYDFALPFYDFIISGVLVLIISVLVSFMFSKRIRRLDMVETLKGVE